MRWNVICIIVCAIAELAHGRVRKLGKYKVDQTKISVSGISAGAEMTTQMHVAYSSLFMGLGIVGGSPYYCAKNDEIVATSACMDEYDDINVTELAVYANGFASSGLIDGTGNMTNDRVFILSGMNDSTVLQGVAKKIVAFYKQYVNADNIKTEFNLLAGHTFPTLNYGNPCDVSENPWIGRCNYDAAFEILDHIYGNLTFYEFGQKEFFPVSPPADSSMDDTGYAYVPTGCISAKNTCKLHVVYHGCLQGKYLLKDKFARHTGYNEVGELNNIIIIYPQAIAVIDNPMGCFDWWGYTVKYYDSKNLHGSALCCRTLPKSNGKATKLANQPLAVYQMIKRVAF